MNIYLVDVLVSWIKSSGLKIVLILILSYIIFKYGRRVISKLVRKIIPSDSRLSKEEEIKREDTIIRILNGTLKIVIVILVTLMTLSEFGVNIAPLIAGAGIVGLAVGFGGQYIIRDIITGLFIILENQYRVGDAVTIAGISGSVEDITLRATTIRDLDGTVHHIPHGEVTTVSNKAKGFARINFDIGVSYAADLEKVIEVTNAVGKELSEDEYFKDLIIKEPEFLRVEAFGDSAVVIKILGETKPLMQWEVTGELRKRLKIAYDKNGIEIPFPQMVVHKG